MFRTVLKIINEQAPDIDLCFSKEVLKTIHSIEFTYRLDLDSQHEYEREKMELSDRIGKETCKVAMAIVRKATEHRFVIEDWLERDNSRVKSVLQKAHEYVMKNVMTKEQVEILNRENKITELP